MSILDRDVFNVDFEEEWRSHFLIRTVIGSTFDWYDFLYYFVGSFLAWVSLRAIEKA